MSQGRRIHGLDAGEREALRRDQIIESAWTVFAEFGYAGTSVEQVCARANVSTKSFYRIFENREHLYLALYEQFCKDAFGRVSSMVDLARQDRQNGPTYFLDALIAAHFEDPRKGLVALGPQRAVTPAVEQARRTVRSEGAEFLMQLWKEAGRGNGKLGVAVATIGGIFDLVAMSMADGRPLGEEQIAQLRSDLELFYRAVAEGLTALD